MIARITQRNPILKATKKKKKKKKKERKKERKLAALPKNSGSIFSTHMMITTL